MKKILFVLFLLCFSVTNTAYAETELPPIDTCFSQANGPDLVSTSKADFAVHVVLNKIHLEGLVAFVNCKHQEISRCRKKWVWRSSKLLTYKNRNSRLINA